jgi:hypothetical protein
MTDKPAAIQAEFCTFRHVQGRKVLQLVFEVPAEAAAHVFAALGHPGGEQIPVAIARLVSVQDKPSQPKPEAKEPRRFDSLPLPQ